VEEVTAVIFVCNCAFFDTVYECPVFDNCTMSQQLSTMVFFLKQRAYHGGYWLFWSDVTTTEVVQSRGETG